jgi:hypothetical protein
MFTATLALLAFGPGAPPEPKAKPMPEQVSIYLTHEQWDAVWKPVEAWVKLPVADRVKLVELLTPPLTDVRHVGLRDTADLIIWYRIDKGDLKFYGHGWGVQQDLFTTGGRAAWAISRLMDKDLPELNAGLTAEEWAKRAAEIAKRAKAFQADPPPASKSK